MRQMRPNVNNNGTTREELVMQRVHVSVAIATAIDALREAAPHGRDYQGLPDYATRYDADRDIWNARLRTLADLQTEIESEALAIHEGGY